MKLRSKKRWKWCYNRGYDLGGDYLLCIIGGDDIFFGSLLGEFFECSFISPET